MGAWGGRPGIRADRAGQGGPRKPARLTTSARKRRNANALSANVQHKASNKPDRRGQKPQKSAIPADPADQLLEPAEIVKTFAAAPP